MAYIHMTEEIAKEWTSDLEDQSEEIYQTEEGTNNLEMSRSEFDICMCLTPKSNVNSHVFLSFQERTNRSRGHTLINAAHVT